MVMNLLLYVTVLVISIIGYYQDTNSFSHIHLIFSHLFFPSLLLCYFTRESNQNIFKILMIIIFIPLSVSGIALFNLKHEIEAVEIFHILSALIGVTLFTSIYFKKYLITKIGILFCFLSLVIGLYQSVGFNYFFPQNINDYEVEGINVFKDDQYILFKDRIRPILEKKCQSCHNESLRHGGLDLTSFESITGKGSFLKFVNKKSLYKSGFYFRSQLNPEDHKHMPKVRGMLSEGELSVIRDWVKRGGLSFIEKKGMKKNQNQNTQGHKRWITDKPALEVNGSIDKSLKKVYKSLQYSEVSLTKPQMLRRLKLNLNGLLPTPEEVQNFESVNALYEDFVDRFIGSESFGEHWTTAWLDYTGYYEGKKFFKANNLKYLNFIINKFNSNFNYFVFLKKFVTPPQKNFQETENRNYFKFQKYEIDEEEDENLAYLVSAERAVENLYSFTLGVNMRCAKCHDHPYAPVSNLDYYSQLFKVKSFYQLSHLDRIDGNLNKNTKLWNKNIDVFSKDAMGQNLPISDWFTNVELGGGFVTARSYVNFSWKVLMGKSLINNELDHYLNTSSPVYLDTLNQLTLRFINNGLSTKWLVKSIVSSDAYKNKYNFLSDIYEFKNVSKIRGESIRDILFQVLGTLKLSPKRNIKDSEFLTVNSSSHYRSIYYSRVLNERFSNLLTIPSTGKSILERDDKSGPNNVFFFNNNNFMHDYIKKLNSKYKIENIQDIEVLYRVLYQRELKENEREYWKLKLISKFDQKIILHSLLSSDEFVFTW